MKQRRGFTLVEMLVVISLMAMILPMAGWLSCMLLRAQTARANALSEGIALSQFARAFRADVHAARRVETPPGPARDAVKLRLHLDPTRVITYAVEPGGTVVRTVTSGRTIERTERFRLTQRETRFEIAKDEREVTAIPEPRDRALLPSARSTFTVKGPAVILIDAVVGRDHRFDRDHRFESPPASSGRPNETGEIRP